MPKRRPLRRVFGDRMVEYGYMLRKKKTPLIRVACLANHASYENFKTEAIMMEQNNSLSMMATTVFGYIPQSVLETPIVTAAVVICIPILVILFLDWLNYQNQRRRLGNIPIVGDAPYLWKRLRWTENESNLKGVFQRGYDTVRYDQAIEFFL